jgi:hypothetical protein
MRIMYFNLIGRGGVIPPIGVFPPIWIILSFGIVRQLGRDNRAPTSGISFSYFYLLPFYFYLSSFSSFGSLVHWNLEFIWNLVLVIWNFLLLLCVSGRLTRHRLPLFPGLLTLPGSDGRLLGAHKPFQSMSLRLPSAFSSL